MMVQYGLIHYLATEAIFILNSNLFNMICSNQFKTTQSRNMSSKGDRLINLTFNILTV